MTNDRETVSGIVNDLECMADWLTSNVLDREFTDFIGRPCVS
jgi:hypothetical protein